MMSWLLTQSVYHSQPAPEAACALVFCSCVNRISGHDGSPGGFLGLTWASTRSFGRLPLACLDSLAARFSAVPFAKSRARLLWPSLCSCIEPVVHAAPS